MAQYRIKPTTLVRLSNLSRGVHAPCIDDFGCHRRLVILHRRELVIDIDLSDYDDVIAHSIGVAPHRHSLTVSVLLHRFARAVLEQQYVARVGCSCG